MKFIHNLIHIYPQPKTDFLYPHFIILKFFRMKKSGFLLCTGIFLMISCNQQNSSKTKYNELLSDNMKGDIQLIEETPYQVDSSGTATMMDSCCITLTEFDVNGNTLKNSEKESSGTVKSASVFTRHENGLFASVLNTEKGKTKNSFKLSFDESGSWNTGEAFDSSGKLEFYYDGIGHNEFGQVTSWIQHKPDSSLGVSANLKYNKNLQTEMTMKDSSGKVMNTTTSKYNDQGEQIETTNVNVGKDSTTTKTTTFKYDTHDEQGNWTQRTTFDEKGKATKVVKRVYTYRVKKAG